MKPKPEGHVISLEEKRWEREGPKELAALRSGQKIRVWPRASSMEAAGELARVVVKENPDGSRVVMFKPFSSNEKVTLDPAQFQWLLADVKKPE